MPAPIGQPFTRVYRERGAPTKDSKTFRVRLWAFVSPFSAKRLDSIRQSLAFHGGISIDGGNSAYVALDYFFKSHDIDDVLDAVTYIYDALGSLGYDGDETETQTDWREFVSKAMREENLGHRVDDLCGVHYFVDEEFERGRVGTIAALDKPAFAGAALAFDQAHKHIDAQPPNTKDAVKSMFEAVEILARQIVPAAKNLNRYVVEHSLRDACLAVAPQDATEQKVRAMLFDSLADWVDAVHYYRHGQGVPEPVEPSEELAVYVLSSGAAFARQLADFALLRGVQPAP